MIVPPDKQRRSHGDTSHIATKSLFYLDLPVLGLPRASTSEFTEFFSQLEVRRRLSSPHKSTLQVHRPQTSLGRQACQGLGFSADLNPVYSCGKVARGTLTRDKCQSFAFASHPEGQEKPGIYKCKHRPLGWAIIYCVTPCAYWNQKGELHSDFRAPSQTSTSQQHSAHLHCVPICLPLHSHSCSVPSPTTQAFLLALQG